MFFSCYDASFFFFFLPLHLLCEGFLFDVILVIYVCAVHTTAIACTVCLSWKRDPCSVALLEFVPSVGRVFPYPNEDLKECTDCKTF